MKKLINKISLAVVTFLVNITNVSASYHKIDLDDIPDGAVPYKPPLFEILKEYFLQAFIISLIITSVAYFFLGKSKKLYILLCAYLTLAILLVMHPSTIMQFVILVLFTIPILVYMYFKKKLKISLLQKIHLLICLTFVSPILLFYIVYYIFGSINVTVLLPILLSIALGVHFYDFRKNWEIILRMHIVSLISITIFVFCYTFYIEIFY